MPGSPPQTPLNIAQACSRRELRRERHPPLLLIESASLGAVPLPSALPACKSALVGATYRLRKAHTMPPKKKEEVIAISLLGTVLLTCLACNLHYSELSYDHGVVSTASNPMNPIAPMAGQGEAPAGPLQEQLEGKQVYNTF